jgi:hypothetical protein
VILLVALIIVEIIEPFQVAEVVDQDIIAMQQDNVFLVAFLNQTGIFVSIDMAKNVEWLQALIIV